jgi:hypothetical protein
VEKLALRRARGDRQVTGLLDGKEIIVHSCSRKDAKAPRKAKILEVMIAVVNQAGH